MSLGGRLAIRLDFPHSYEVKAVESSPLLNPGEELYQFPVRLEEGDRSGIYLHVMPEDSRAWLGFFARGFDANEVPSALYSCPDPGSLCVVAGGYAYIVDTHDPEHWIQVDQRPVLQVRLLADLKLLLFIGSTSVSGLGEAGLHWTTERLSWEGITLGRVQDSILYGTGWDMITDQEVPFEIDLLTGSAKGGARPQIVAKL